MLFGRCIKQNFGGIFWGFFIKENYKAFTSVIEEFLNDATYYCIPFTGGYVTYLTVLSQLPAAKSEFSWLTVKSVTSPDKPRKNILTRSIESNAKYRRKVSKYSLMQIYVVYEECIAT
uniref:Uncharacterized protein n=1 Tax=Romanomermis culicivorax TaxID=13658 RepID=A0A915LBB7_ROMCU